MFCLFKLNKKFFQLIYKLVYLLQSWSYCDKISVSVSVLAVDIRDIWTVYNINSNNGGDCVMVMWGHVRLQTPPPGYYQLTSAQPASTVSQHTAVKWTHFDVPVQSRRQAVGRAFYFQGTILIPVTSKAGQSQIMHILRSPSSFSFSFSSHFMVINVDNNMLHYLTPKLT